MSDKSVSNSACKKKREVAQAIAEARVLVRRYTEGNPESSVDAFLKNRRGEWGEPDSSEP